MTKKNRVIKKDNKVIQQVLKQQYPEKNNILIFGGVILSMSSIGLLIFVLSEKVFHLS